MDGRVIRNAATGERIVIRTSAADLLAFDLYLPPGGHVPARHAHPLQEERFVIVEGELEFRIGQAIIQAAAGSSITVPANTKHWFGNRGPTPAHAYVEVRPALRMEELLAMSERINTPGKCITRKISETLLLLATFDRELALPLLLRLALVPVTLLSRNSA
jgi:quercetin dioxygenase-like cupin family protein